MPNPTHNQPAGDRSHPGVQDGVQSPGLARIDQRTTFVIYTDSMCPTVEHLSMEERGQVFTALLAYRNGEPVEVKGLMAAVLAPHFATMDRDDVKFAERVSKNRENGAKGGRPPKAKETQNNPSVISETQKTRDGDGDGDGDGDERETITKDSCPAPSSPDPRVSQVVALLNGETGSKYRASTKAHAKHISARLCEGFSLEDLLLVARHKAREWGGDPRMAQYLRPETLFGNKFQGYLLAAKTPATTSAKATGRHDLSNIKYESGYI